MLNENVDNLLYIPYSGSVLLNLLFLIKEVVFFSEEERVIFNLEGLLPNAVKQLRSNPIEHIASLAILSLLLQSISTLGTFRTLTKHYSIIW